VTTDRNDPAARGPGAQHVVSRLMRESLVDKQVISSTEAPVRAILPKLNVLQIGGISIMDRGSSAVLPLLDEIIANQHQHMQVVGVGPGVRGRHILSVGLDLGLPTGAIATLAAKSSAQNAYMVSCLLANSGFVYLEAPFIVQLLPAMLAAARGAVFNGIPPYDLWEHPPALGKIPPHGSDAGSYLVGEVFGARSIILLKDVDGLYTADPKTNPDAEFIPEIDAAELIARKLHCQERVSSFSELTRITDHCVLGPSNSRLSSDPTMRRDYPELTGFSRRRERQCGSPAAAAAGSIRRTHPFASTSSAMTASRRAARRRPPSMTARLRSRQKRSCMLRRSAASGCWPCGTLCPVSRNGGKLATAQPSSISCGRRSRPCPSRNPTQSARQSRTQ